MPLDKNCEFQTKRKIQEQKTIIPVEKEKKSKKYSYRFFHEVKFRSTGVN